MIKTIQTKDPHYKLYARSEYDSDADVIREAFDENVYQLKAELFSGDKVFLDIGANIGSQSLYVSSIVPDARIIAIEPQPENFSLLESNVEMNGKHFELDNRAVWYKAGKMKIKADSGGSYLSDDGQDEVELVTLATIFAEYDLDDVSVMKVDIERQNAERLLINTPIELLSHCESLCVEFDGYEGSDKTLLGSLIQHLNSHFHIDYIGNENTGGNLWATRKKGKI